MSQTPFETKATPPILRWFDHAHLPVHLQAVVQPFSILAHDLAADLPADAETSTALRKLVEAKDAAVRAAIIKHERENQS